MVKHINLRWCAPQSQPFNTGMELHAGRLLPGRQCRILLRQQAHLQRLLAVHALQRCKQHRRWFGGNGPPELLRPPTIRSLAKAVHQCRPQMAQTALAVKAQAHLLVPPGSRPRSCRVCFATSCSTQQPPQH